MTFRSNYFKNHLQIVFVDVSFIVFEISHKVSCLWFNRNVIIFLYVLENLMQGSSRSFAYQNEKPQILIHELNENSHLMNVNFSESIFICLLMFYFSLNYLNHFHWSNFKLILKVWNHFFSHWITFFVIICKQENYRTSRTEEYWLIQWNINSSLILYFLTTIENNCVN